MIATGESETVEFKSRVPDPGILARIIGAFANGRGGHILVGVDDSGVIVGAGDKRTSELAVSAALRMLEPIPRVLVTEFGVWGKSVVSVAVDSSATAVVGPQGLAIRQGAENRILTVRETLDRMKGETPEKVALAMHAMSRQLGSLTEKIDAQANELTKLNSWRRKGLWAGLGAILGALAKYGTEFLPTP